MDNSFTSLGRAQFKTGIAKVTFPVIGGSGYRVYFTTVSESPLEDQEIAFYISNCERVFDDQTNIPLIRNFRAIALAV